MKLRWFLSGTVRQATEMCKHVRKLLNAQRDILSPPAVEAVALALDQTKEAIDSNADKVTLEKQMADLEKAANKWLKPYPHAEWRENIEVFLVAIVVAMGIRTFFLQPFKIPTGSMQPTLFGVTPENLINEPNFKMPGLSTRIFDACARGTFYHEWIAEDDGEIVNVSQPQHFLRFINKQTVSVNYSNGRSENKTFWFTPDEDSSARRGNVLEQMVRPTFRKGESILRFSETTGDHLFVDRVTYNFRRPSRGEIIVFKTKGIPGIADQNQFYIKRLVGLPNERVSIGDDRHARINGQRLDASTPHFENVYGFDPKSEPESSRYSGHTHAHTLMSESDSIPVRDKHYLVFGDNTMNSADSRYWGDLPQENVIGKSCFVYWPILGKRTLGNSTTGSESRFGWCQR